MRVVRFCSLLISLLLCPQLTFAVQSSTPEAALEEMVTADSLDTLARHLPVKVEEAINKIGGKEKEQLTGKLLARRLMESKGITLHKTEDGSGWEVVDDKQQVQGSIKLKSNFISGTDAMLVLEATEAKESDSNERPSYSKAEKRRTRILVSMRLQEGEWRLIEFGPWESKSLEAEDFLRGLGLGAQNESEAIGTLRVLSAALSTYASTYPKVGLPLNLPALSGEVGQEASAEHAMLLDPSFAAAPLVRDGYRFQYTLGDRGVGNEQGGTYRITATPIEFSKDSGKSLFIDQTGVIRATTENRDANENDEPLRRYAQYGPD